MQPQTKYIVAQNQPKLSKIRALPFLKWAGGKRSILPQIKTYLPKSFNDYYEPFLGGGAVFFGLQEHITQKAYLSDINAELIVTYQVVQSYHERLINQLRQHQANHSDEYYKSIRMQCLSENSSAPNLLGLFEKKFLNNQDLLDKWIKLAARFIYLNRTCFNGLYRVNGKGQFNVPVGRYTNPTICDEKNLLLVSEALRKVCLFCQDFETVCPKSNDFIYCDPPYSGTFTGYSTGGFDDQAQKRLKKAADSWRNKGAKVMLSNSDLPIIRNLYKDYRIIEVSAPRVINCKGHGRHHTIELLIMNY